MTKRLLAATALAVAAMLAFLVPSASAQQYQPTATLVLSSSTARPGDTITASGTGCTPNATVSLFFGGVDLTTTTADSTGAFSTQITIPSNATPGVHEISDSCGASSNITILSASGTGGGGTGGGGSQEGGVTNTGAPLARTGTNSTIPMTQIGFGLLAAGGVMLVLARKKRSTVSA